MKPKSVVTCLPSKDLEKALEFYIGCFELETSGIEDGVITIELANLSLFVMSETAYGHYAQKANVGAGYPGNDVQCLFSCAVADTSMIEHVFAKAEEYGGAVAQPMLENEWGQRAGYIRDPDGHLWEIVHVAE